MCSLQTSFREHTMGQGKLVKGAGGGKHEISVICMPLYSLMLALNTTKIDYFRYYIFVRTKHTSVTSFKYKYDQGGDIAWLRDWGAVGMSTVHVYAMRSKIVSYKNTMYISCIKSCMVLV